MDMFTQLFHSIDRTSTQILPDILLFSSLASMLQSCTQLLRCQSTRHNFQHLWLILCFWFHPYSQTTSFTNDTTLSFTWTGPWLQPYFWHRMASKSFVRRGMETRSPSTTQTYSSSVSSISDLTRGENFTTGQTSTNRLGVMCSLWINGYLMKSWTIVSSIQRTFSSILISQKNSPGISGNLWKSKREDE